MVGGGEGGQVAAQADAVAKAGSGFFLGGGRLVTAAHLVAGCVAVRVVPEGGGELPAEVEASDLELDLAVLRVRGAAAVVAELAPGLPAPGTRLVARGYPEAASSGALTGLALTAVELPIARPPERLPLRGAVAHAGMSGAPVVDARGLVVGMLLGRGDPAAPGAAELARRIGYPVAEIAIILPAEWLPRPDGAAIGPVVVARVLCLAG